MPTPYDINPPPQQGNGPFGLVPGPVGMPNPYQDLAGVFPNLSGVNQNLSNDILNQLQGRLNPATIANIQDQAAAWGLRSGMPGFNPGSLTGNKALRNLGLQTEDLINSGIKNYNATIPTVSGTQTVNPNLQAAIAANNALNRAAPNPEQAQRYAQELFNAYLQSMLNARGPAGGTGGGMGNPFAGLPTGTLGQRGYNPDFNPTYTGPRGFGFNDLAPGSGGSAGGLDAESQYWMDQLNNPTFEDLASNDPYMDFSGNFEDFASSDPYMDFSFDPALDYGGDF